MPCIFEWNTKFPFMLLWIMCLRAAFFWPWKWYCVVAHVFFWGLFAAANVILNSINVGMFQNYTGPHCDSGAFCGQVWFLSMPTFMLFRLFFSVFGPKLDLIKKSKNSIPPKKINFRRQKLDFSDNFSTTWPFFAPENCNESQNQWKKAHFRPENNLKRKNSIWNAKNSIWNAKNSILKAKNSIFRHFTQVDLSAFAL